MRAVRLPTHFTVPMEAHRVTMQKPIEAWTIGLRLVPDGDSLSPGSKPVFLTQRRSPSKITLRQFVLETGQTHPTRCRTVAGVTTLSASHLAKHEGGQEAGHGDQSGKGMGHFKRFRDHGVDQHGQDGACRDGSGGGDDFR